MSNAKIDIKIGIVEFSGEGEPKWLSEQLDKILEKVPELMNIKIPTESDSPSKPISNGTPSTVSTPSTSKKTLSTFIKENNPKTQPQLFLLTSIWMHNNLGKSRIQHAEVNEQLKKSNQKPIKKLSQELGRNVRDGYIVKDGSQYYVTPEGMKQF